LRWWLLRDLGDKAVAAADGWPYCGPNIRYLGEGYFRNLKSESPAEDPATHAVRPPRNPRIWCPSA